MNHEEQITLETISTIWNCDYHHATQKYPSIDGIFTRQNELKGIYSIKSRTQTLSWFKDYKSVVVNIDKIINGADLSKNLRCPYFIIFRTSCKKIILFQITDNDGKIICDMNIRARTDEKEPDIRKTITSAYLLIPENLNCFIFDEDKYAEKVAERYNNRKKED